MKEFVTILRHEIELKIHTVESNENDYLANIKDIISTIQTSLIRLKSFIIQYEFISPDEEILFFKELKPQIYSQLLFYVRLYKIEANRPVANKASENVYLSQELRTLNQTFTNSLDFCKYYRSGATSLDFKYFLRKEYDWALDLDPLSFEKDLGFSTSFDYEVSNIIANDLLKVFLISQIKLLNEEVNTDLISLFSGNQMQWTDSKVSLIELVYSIHSSKSVNHGTVDLKDLITCFETIFNIKIGDFYRTFLEIRERKKNRTQYLDQMRSALVARMDNFDK